MLEFTVFVAAAFSLLAALAYIRAMFKGHAKPNRVTWLMWSVAPFVATAASVSMGAGLAAVPVFMAGFAPFMIFIASFLSKKAYWKLSTFDYACGGFSALAIILWFLTSDPVLAIVLSIIADALAAVPTVIKAWHKPKTESIWPFLIGTLSPFTSFLVASSWSFSELSFPTYLISINLLLICLIMRK
jgi:hypothetical protein